MRSSGSLLVDEGSDSKWRSKSLGLDIRRFVVSVWIEPADAKQRSRLRGEIREADPFRPGSGGERRFFEGLTALPGAIASVLRLSPSDLAELEPDRSGTSEAPDGSSNNGTDDAT